MQNIDYIYIFIYIYANICDVGVIYIIFKNTVAYLL